MSQPASRDQTAGITPGAHWLGGTRWSFRVWAPTADHVDLHVLSPEELVTRLTPEASGYFHGEIDGIPAGARYRYKLNNSDKELPDPASRHQPEGVHGASATVPAAFPWTDGGWRGLALSDYVLYEIHVGTFTAGGTFEAVIEKLDDLRDLGITALEIMPVAQFPGERNWGYDGVFPYAAQNSYGGPAGLKRLVDAAHARGLAIVLDVVYNHLGPEGNYLAAYGPYFTDRYTTPWGKAVNYDGDGSAHVRRFIIENALQWTQEFHVDALRLDAVHAIFDASDCHILQELGQAVHAAAGHRRVHVIAESNLNDVRLVRTIPEGGYGLDAQWNDDFHHALHTVLTGETNGYLQDYGSIRHLEKAYAEGFVYSGQYSRFRKRPYGTSAADLPRERLVVFSQNHDQVGNRMLGERQAQLLDWEQLKLSAAALILAPYVPMVFMGQEYAETAPFLYFVHHSDPSLIAAVRKGRREEFRSFAWKGECPDPQSEATFLRSKLDHTRMLSDKGRVLHNYHRELLRLRKSSAALRIPANNRCEVRCMEDAGTILLLRSSEAEQTAVILHFGAEDAQMEISMPAGTWLKVLDSADALWMGPATGACSMASEGRWSFTLPRHCACVLVRRL